MVLLNKIEEQSKSSTETKLRWRSLDGFLFKINLKGVLCFKNG